MTGGESERLNDDDDKFLFVRTLKKIVFVDIRKDVHVWKNFCQIKGK